MSHNLDLGNIFILADCTLGEWAAWGECEPSYGTCGNGTKRRLKEELLESRNGGECVTPTEQGKCTKDCSAPSAKSADTGLLFGPYILLKKSEKIIIRNNCGSYNSDFASSIYWSRSRLHYQKET